jgi:hypothetical protein
VTSHCDNRAEVCLKGAVEILGQGTASQGSPFDIVVSVPMESIMAERKKARAVGFNHVALEVGNIEEALAFYARLFDFGAVAVGETRRW